MSFMSLALPANNIKSSSSISSCIVSPLPLASILDHYLRRGEGQDRVFGTLLGYKNHLNQILVLTSFGIPYVATSTGAGDVQIDMDHHRLLLDLHLKVNPKEVVVGWYTTDPTLNSFSALIHNFYTAETASSSTAAIHLTLDPSTLSFNTYVASPIGTSATPRPNHLAFLPVESILRVSEGERGGIDLLTSNLTSLSLAAAASSSALTLPTTDESITSPLTTLYGLLTKVNIMLEQVLNYVKAVNAGERSGDERVGRALLETVGIVPSSNASATGAAGGNNTTTTTTTSGGEKKTRGFEEEFNAHLADVLMVSYLASVLKTQTEISSRLNLLV